MLHLLTEYTVHQKKLEMLLSHENKLDRLFIPSKSYLIIFKLNCNMIPSLREPIFEPYRLVTITTTII